MKYLFFDIECSNCFNDVGKMCEFGYVITDENFKILSAYDIPMSPGTGYGDRFHLRDRMKAEDIHLAYDEDYYFEQPELPEFYSRIKKIMEDKETICFAFSMRNDIRYLHDSCDKYHLPSLNYTCYDIQQFAADYLETSTQPGLKKCVDEIVGPHAINGLTEHLSRDDAKMGMMITEAICILSKIDSVTLLEKYKSSSVNSIEFMQSYRAEKVLREAKKKLRSYIDNKAKADFELTEQESYRGKRYNLSSIVRPNVEEAKKIIDLIHKQGGLFVLKFDHTDVLIVKDEKDLNFFKERYADVYKGKFLLLDDFLAKCNGGN